MLKITLIAVLFSLTGYGKNYTIGRGTDSVSYPTGCAYCDGASWVVARTNATQNAKTLCKSDVEMVGQWQEDFRTHKQSSGMTREHVTAEAQFMCI